MTLTQEFQGARERRWNSEKPLVFAAVTLQMTPGVRRSKETWQRLARRVDLWDQGCVSALVDDMEAEIKSRIQGYRAPDKEAMVRACNAKVLSGRLRSACRVLTSRDEAGRQVCQNWAASGGRPSCQAPSPEGATFSLGVRRAHSKLATQFPPPSQLTLQPRTQSRSPQGSREPLAPGARTPLTCVTGCFGLGRSGKASEQRRPSGPRGWPMAVLLGQPVEH